LGGRRVRNRRAGDSDLRGSAAGIEDAASGPLNAGHRRGSTGMKHAGRYTSDSTRNHYSRTVLRVKAGSGQEHCEEPAKRRHGCSSLYPICTAETATPPHFRCGGGERSLASTIRQRGTTTFSSRGEESTSAEPAEASASQPERKRRRRDAPD